MQIVFSITREKHDSLTDGNLKIWRRLEKNPYIEIILTEIKRQVKWVRWLEIILKIKELNITFSPI